MVYLTDFGISRAPKANTALMETGGVIGTPAYMAPERCLNLGFDARTDIYAVGVILYEMVLGQLPYRADTPMAVTLAHVHEPLPLPRDFDPNIPEAIESVILKCLAKLPNDRYQTAIELLEGLRLTI